MSYHILTADGHLYHCDSAGDELCHYGVPGMKWGQRKALKRTARYEKKLSRAGRRFGAADYERSQGDEAMRKHEHNAKVLDKAAKKYESEGKLFRAEAARKSAAALRSRGANIKAGHDADARRIEARAEKLQNKANKYATKKKVDLGKSKADDILNRSKNVGFNEAKSWAEFGKRMEIESKYGANALSAYDKIRGKS